MCAKIILLFSKESAWAKRTDPEGSFVIVLGTFDSADLCDLVGNFILDMQQNKFLSTSFRLYRDELLALSRGDNGHTVDMLRKDFTTP